MSAGLELTQKCVSLDLATMLNFLAGVPGWVWGVVGVVAIALTIYYGRKAATRRQVRAEVERAQRPDAAVSYKDEPLVSYKTFYGDEIGERHEFKFVGERAELVRVGAKDEVEKSKPLAAIVDFITGPEQMLVVCGSGGLGKSRLLIEAAKVKPRVRFAQTRLFGKNLAGLTALLRDKAKKDDVIVFDDCHEYATEFEALLGAALRAGAKVIAATRYLSSIEKALEATHVRPEVVELGRMVNAATIVPAREDVLTDIARLSEGNPALAVAAYLYWLRLPDGEKTLVGIPDSFGLLKKVFDDLVKAGGAHAREFLGELSVRRGLFEHELKSSEYKKLLAVLKGMGYVSSWAVGDENGYRVVPDKLRDYIIQTVYVLNGELMPEFDRVINDLPDTDAVNVIDMLAIQYRETRQEAWKQACARLLSKYADKEHGPGIGFGANIQRKPLELLIDIGYEAWESFGDLRLVVDVLGDFCAGAEKLESIETLNKAAMFYHKTGEPDRALKCYEKGLTVAERDGDKLGAAAFLGNIGLVWKDKGEWDKALEYHEKALNLYRRLGDRQGEAGQLGNIGNVYHLKGEWDKALASFEKVLKVFDELGAKQEQASVLDNIGLVWKDKGEWDKALEYHEKSARMHHAMGSLLNEAQALGNIGLVWQRKGEWDRALEYQEKALRLDREVGNKLGEARTLGNIGLVWQAKGEWDKALEYHEKSAMMHHEMGNLLNEAHALGNIGLVWKNKGAWDKALDYQEKCLRVRQEIGDRQGVAIALGNIGNVYHLKGEWHSALEYLEKGMRIQEEIGDRQGVAAKLGNIGLVWKSRGEWDKALKFFSEAVAIQQQMGNTQGQASQFGNIGNTLVRMGRYEEAVLRLAQALSVFLQMGAGDGPQQCLRGLNECLEAMGRERFRAACAKAGMAEEQARGLAEALVKAEA